MYKPNNTKVKSIAKMIKVTDIPNFTEVYSDTSAE